MKDGVSRKQLVESIIKSGDLTVPKGMTKNEFISKREEEIQKLSVEVNKGLSTSSIRNAEFAPLARKATSVLKRKVRIQSDPNGNGKITFSFLDENDLKTLLDRLGVH